MTAKTAKTATSLLEGTAKKSGKVTPIICADQDELANRTLRLKGVLVHIEAIYKACEAKVKEIARKLYSDANARDSSVVFQGTDGEFKAVFKAVFTPIDIDALPEIMAIFSEQAQSEGLTVPREIKERAQGLFNDYFEIKTVLEVSQPTDAQVALLDSALKLAAMAVEANTTDGASSIIENMVAEGKKIQRLANREGAAISFEEVYTSERQIVVRPIMAEAQFTMDARIREMLKQQTPGLTISAKEIAKINVRSEIANLMAEIASQTPTGDAVETISA